MYGKAGAANKKEEKVGELKTFISADDFEEGKKFYCEKCGKELTTGIIHIVSLARKEELILCVNCFNTANSKTI